MDSDSSSEKGWMVVGPAAAFLSVARILTISKFALRRLLIFCRGCFVDSGTADRTVVLKVVATVDDFRETGEAVM